MFHLRNLEFNMLRHLHVRPYLIFMEMLCAYCPVLYCLSRTYSGDNWAHHHLIYYWVSEIAIHIR
jgi:hypothetical protein